MLAVIKMEEYSLLHGQLLSRKGLNQLALIFAPLNVQLRESSHYQGGSYLLITDEAETELTFEKIESDEFLIKGEAPTKEGIIQLSQKVSQRLTSEKLKHRLELYDAAGNQFLYFNYNWKQK
jgi:hypothetical protein